MLCNELKNRARHVRGGQGKTEEANGTGSESDPLSSEVSPDVIFNRNYRIKTL